MRREPMQVLPRSVAAYERCRTQPSDATTTTNDGVVVANGPRLVDEPPSRQPPSRSTTEAANDVDVVDGSSSTADRQNEDVDDMAAVLVRPVVRDVKLCPRPSAVSSTAARPALRAARTWRSTESIDRLITSATAPDTAGGPTTRSSFVDPATGGVGATSAGRRSVYIDLGEYQTLLKHGRHDAVYSLPQSHCYGDDTLRAVKLITDKYDTFKRRQMRALSFRDAAAAKTSRQQSSHAIAEGLFLSQGRRVPCIFRVRSECVRIPRGNFFSVVSYRFSHSVE